VKLRKYSTHFTSLLRTQDISPGLVRVLSRRQLVHDEYGMWRIGEDEEDQGEAEQEEASRTDDPPYGVRDRIQDTAGLSVGNERSSETRCYSEAKRYQANRASPACTGRCQFSRHNRAALAANPQRCQRQSECERTDSFTRSAVGMGVLLAVLQMVSQGLQYGQSEDACPKGFVDPPINRSPARNRRTLTLLSSSFLD
jgi:hypothetical protein